VEADLAGGTVMDQREDLLIVEWDNPATDEEFERALGGLLRNPGWFVVEVVVSLGRFPGMTLVGYRRREGARIDQWGRP
jgi:hypothetical protein